MTLYDLVNNTTLDGNIHLRAYREWENGDVEELLEAEYKGSYLNKYGECEVKFIYADDDVLYIEVEVPVRKYTVTITELRSTDIEVYAMTEEEAEKIAEEQYDSDEKNLWWYGQEIQDMICKEE